MIRLSLCYNTNIQNVCASVKLFYMLYSMFCGINILIGLGWYGIVGWGGGGYPLAGKCAYPLIPSNKFSIFENFYPVITIINTTYCVLFK